MNVGQRFIDIVQLAKTLMHQHSVGHWGFGFDRSRMSYGKCWHNKKKITLSKYFCANLDNDILDIKDTILHEIAHAVMQERYPYIRPGHGDMWKKIAKEIGCRPTRTSNDSTMPKGKYQAFCPICGDMKIYMHRMGGAMKSGRYRCNKCSSVIGWRCIVPNFSAKNKIQKGSKQ